MTPDNKFFTKVTNCSELCLLPTPNVDQLGGGRQRRALKVKGGQDQAALDFFPAISRITMKGTRPLFGFTDLESSIHTGTF